IPFQHASPRILKAMKRPAATENTLARIHAWRQTCPELTIRSTFIVGFPGETEQDFATLLEFLQQAQLDRVGCFEYSPVDGASANALPDPVPDAIKRERYERFMQTQQLISAARLQAKIGSTQTVIVDGIDAERDCLVARSPADAPEIDGLVYVDADGEYHPGQLLEVTVTAADDYDLYASVNT
ncbi:MAG: 30S ribosomal protein S12 methylthiotransferase RimO, partial [Pseudomonadales bacterium]